MSLLTVANLRHAYGSDVVLDGATLSIAPGEKVGLVGRNGCGKTTLLKAILGSLHPDSGSIQLARNARVGYLSQDPEFDPQEAVRDTAEGAFAELHRLHVELHGVFHEMADAAGELLERLLRKQARLESAIEAAGGYAIDHRIDATLHGLGFTDDQFNLPVGSLSGGQKNRLGLARLLLESPDLLLLDEPTNHLDIAGREWLETFLADEFGGAVLVVSHDRWLLDRVVDRIIEIERGVIRDYPGTFQQYVTLRRERMLTESRVYEKQLDRIRHEEKFIARYKAGQRARQARGRQSKLERFKRDELVERPVVAEVMKIRLPEIDRSGDLVIVAESVTKRFGDLTLFEHLDLTISRGERVGIIGPNGVGKTTLARCLLGETEPSEGAVRLGSRTNVGHFRQSQQELDRQLTVWQYLQSVIAGHDSGARASEQQARDLAGAFLFSGDEQDKALGDLSGGERTRAVLAGLIGSAHNVLVLDEPTNHLDIPSAERLEQAISSEGGFEGTLLLITHDRALLEATCDRLLVFEGGGRVRDFRGRYSEWKARIEQDRLSPQCAPAEPKRRSRSESAPARLSTGSSESRHATMTLGRLEARIETIETRIREIDEMMLDPDVYTNGAKCRALQEERGALQEELVPLEFEWSRRAEDA